ncbi:MAG: hypothetical protein QGF68_19875, partial [Nitrospinota bacterium]|nr:hypothetical protein [Nitrospinota bacterium]
IKLYPCGRYFHGAVDSVLTLVNNEDLPPDRIREIRVTVSRNGYNMTCEPKSERVQPRTSPHAAFSLYYCLAAAAVRKQLFLDEFSDEALADPDIQSLAQRVIPEVDDRLGHLARVIPPTPVEIVTTDGESFHNTTEYPRGHPANPVKFDEVFEKVKACAACAVKPIPEDNLLKFKEAAAALEDLDDVSSIPAWLTG